MERWRRPDRDKRLIEKLKQFRIVGGVGGYDLHLRQFLAIADNTKRSNGLDSLYDISYLSFKFGMLQGLRYSAKHSGEEIRETLDKAERGELGTKSF